MSSKSEPESSTDGGPESRKRTRKDEFSSTFSMIVTLLGFSFGTADTWRFPFLVYRNGGGAFLIPFVITIVVCGIPMYFLEFSIANFSGKAAFAIWDICPVFQGVGICLAVGYFVWIIGAAIFRSWMGMFLVDSFKNPLPWTHCNNSWNTPSCKPHQFITSALSNVTTPTSYLSNDTIILRNVSVVDSTKWMTAAEEYWQYEALNLSSGITDFAPILWKHILFMLVIRAAVFLSLIKSIKSIEKVMYVLTFVPIVFLLVVMVQSMTLPGAMEGLYEFFYPDFAKLKSPRIWIEAFLMAFYTLDFGWGAIITLGSHANFKVNCIRTGIFVPVLDCLYGVVNGAVCFMILGNMAHAYNVNIYDVINAGFSTGIVTYVTALSALPIPQFWNFTFIFVTLLAGLDAQIVAVEMCLQVIGEMYPYLFPKYRIRTLAIMSVLLFVLALPTCTGAGGYIFLWIDWYLGTWVGPISAFIELIVVGWCYGIDRFSMDVSLMIGKQVPWFFRIFIFAIAPAVVLVIFLTSCVEYVPPTYGSYIYPTWTRGVGWLMVLCVMSPIVFKAISVVHQQTGSLWMRIRNSTKCTPNWGPKDPDAKIEFDYRRTLHKNKTFKDMLYFIMFGSYRDEIGSNITQEMSALVHK